MTPIEKQIKRLTQLKQTNQKLMSQIRSSGVSVEASSVANLQQKLREKNKQSFNELWKQHKFLKKIDGSFPLISQQTKNQLIQVISKHKFYNPQTGRILITKLTQHLEKHDPILKQRIWKSKSIWKSKIKESKISHLPNPDQVMKYLEPHQANKLMNIDKNLIAEYTKSGQGIDTIDNRLLNKLKNKKLFLQNSIKYKHSLRSVELSRLKKEDFEALLRILPSLTELRRLSIKNTTINEANAEALVGSFRYLKKLEFLELSQNNLEDEIAIIIEDLGQLKNLKSLVINFNEIGYYGSIYLSNQLQKLKNLELLNLRCDELDEDDIIEIEKAFPYLTRLKMLDLSNNELKDDGVVELFIMLSKYLTSLEILNLENIVISEVGATVIAESLPHLPNLQQLYLGRNWLGNEGVKALARFLPHQTNLKILGLQENDIGDEGAVALAESLPSLTNLEKLEIESNEINTRGYRALARVLRSIRHIDVDFDPSQYQQQSQQQSQQRQCSKCGRYLQTTDDYICRYHGRDC